MWKKGEPARETPTRGEATSSSARSVSKTAPKAPTSNSGRTATIGPSIQVKGDVTGDESLLVEGSVEGGITLESHDVTIGESGRVQADVRGRSIWVEGRVTGNLIGEDAVVIRKSGSVEGNITAARVTLENGSTFRGNIDMGPRQKKGSGSARA